MHTALTRTYPPYPIACPGDRLVFTCITNSGTVVWRADNGDITQLLTPSRSTIAGSLLLIITDENNTTVTSTATIESISLSLNGKMVGCSGTSLTQFDLLAINVTG